MKSLKSVAALAAAALVTASASYASAATTKPFFHCGTRIVEVAVESDGWLFFRGDEAKASNGNGIYVCSVKDTPSLCQAWLSQLQAASLSGRRVVLNVPAGSIASTASDETACQNLPSAKTAGWLTYIKILD